MRQSPLLVACVLLALAGCAAPRLPEPAEPATFRASAPLSCVPFARALSGIALQGDAHGWWRAAAGRYSRGAEPQPGAVLVLKSTRRLPDGHLAVVVRQTGAREILVAHANWASGAARGAVHQNQRVVDVSRRNDWSAVRVWHPATDTLGVTVFPAWGFIHPPAPRTAEQVAAAVPHAAQEAALLVASR
ncbi:CHAP domain-containing protein [Elioraea sp. Yellowstone]|jgi:hypothetical protein|uniref:CHAP domain-containing protein n=1 Tax=Elioraea sp. Yellowstone TaxID=2592070 RepID=UPI00192A295B|nr:CHAP domain-containing protein [Elioraea sp. Yellowstone]